jgi:hypothetical protein
MSWSVQPEPTDETERRALLEALRRALVEEAGGASAYATPWWRSGFEDLRGGAASEQPWGESRVVEP